MGGFRGKTFPLEKKKLFKTDTLIEILSLRLYEKSEKASVLAK